MLNSKTIAAVLMLLSFRVVAQDSLMVETETKKPLLSAIAVSVDYGKLLGQILKTESKYELGGQVEFKDRLFVVGEYGLSTLTPNGAYQNTEYESEGNYFRIGLGYKISFKAKNNIYFSARYAKADFKDQGIIDISSASGLFDDLNEPFRRDGLSANWYEFVMSSEAKLWKSLYAGFHFRFRVMNKYDKQEPLDVYSVPGYGRTFDRTIPALNLYIKYALQRF